MSKLAPSYPTLRIVHGIHDADSRIFLDDIDLTQSCLAYDIEASFTNSGPAQAKLTLLVNAVKEQAPCRSCGGQP